MKKFLLLFFCSLALAASAAPKKQAPIISAGPNGTLKYDLDDNGDRVIDFSTCGYAGADHPIPNVPVKVVIAPENGDETADLQRALDYVGTLPADDTGCRGKVLLLKGVHRVAGQLIITNSGVVIGGQGMTPDDTVLLATGTDRRTPHPPRPQRPPHSRSERPQLRPLRHHRRPRRRRRPQLSFR